MNLILLKTLPFFGIVATSFILIKNVTKKTRRKNALRHRIVTGIQDHQLQIKFLEIGYETHQKALESREQCKTIHQHSMVVDLIQTSSPHQDRESNILKHLCCFTLSREPSL